MSSWLPWAIFAALFVIAAAMRLFAGDDPDNAITHESGREEPRDGELADGEEEGRRAGPATGQAGDVQLAA